MKFLEQVFPRVLQFKPDFILISAGFDGHERDLLGQVSNIALNEFDFAWITKEIIKISNTCCEGRIMSMLEGGYNTKGGGLCSPLGNSIFNHIYELSHDNGQIIPDKGQDFDSRKRKYSMISESLLKQNKEDNIYKKRLRRIPLKQSTKDQGNTVSSTVEKPNCANERIRNIAKEIVTTLIENINFN